MLNYLSAELWRIGQRRQNKVCWALYLLCVAAMAAAWGFAELTHALDVLTDTLAVGLYLTFPIAMMADEEIWRAGVLGNEVSCGISRRRVYLGKLFAALIAGLILFALTALVFLTVALLLANPSPPDELSLAWARLGRGILAALPRYIGALSLVHMLCFSLRASGVAPVLYYIYITVVELFLGAVNAEGLGVVGEALNTLSGAVRPFLLSDAFFTYGRDAVSAGVLESWGTGCLWLVLTSAVGLAVFRRREIK